MNVVPQGFLNMAGYIESDYLPTVKADGNEVAIETLEIAHEGLNILS